MDIRDAETLDLMLFRGYQASVREHFRTKTRTAGGGRGDDDRRNYVWQLVVRFRLAMKEVEEDYGPPDAR
jgi:hypothetical protein